MGWRAPRRLQPGRAPPRLARLAVLLCAALVAGPARAAVPHLVVTTADGEVLADAPLPGDGRWRLEWRHSVAQVTVVDVFEYRDGVMLVVEELTPYLDVAGLGGFAGRGTMEQLPDGRYLLHGIDLPIPGNVHRFIIGSERAPSVLVVGERRYELSRMRPGEHARLEVMPR
ncbi:MAG TPA: DUF1850 domain-containing protein [Trueperaceae bacterium]|jgi:hypothetical protein